MCSYDVEFTVYGAGAVRLRRRPKCAVAQ